MLEKALILGLLFVACGCAGAPAASSAAAPCAGPSAPPVLTAPRDPLADLSNEELALRLGEAYGSDDELRQRFADMAVAFGAQVQKTGRPFDRTVIDNVGGEDIRELRLRIAKASLPHYDRRTLLASVKFFESDEGKSFSKAQGALNAAMLPILFDWMKGLMGRVAPHSKDGG